MKKYLRLKEKNIIKYKNKHNWQGNGDEIHAPLVIDSINPQYSKLKLKNLKRFIDISALSLDYVYLTGCRYVSIEGCEFKYFNLASCQNIVVRNNFLPVFTLLYSRNNKIIGNQISERDYDGVKNSLGEREDSKKLNVVLGIWVALIFFILSYGGSHYSTFVYLIFFIIVLGVLVYFKIRYIVLIKRGATLPDNIFTHNVKIPVEI